MNAGSAASSGHHDIWNRKPVLQVIYDDFYPPHCSGCRPGSRSRSAAASEVSKSGSDVVATDIQPAPWLDCVADAQRLPFATGSVSQYRDGRCAASPRISGHVFSRGGARLVRAGACSWRSRRSPGAAPRSIGSSTMSRCGPRSTHWRRESRIPAAIPMMGTRPSRPCSPRASVSGFTGYSRASRRAGRMVLARGLSAERRLSALEPLGAGMTRRCCASNGRSSPVLGRFMGFRMLLTVEKMADRER